MKIIIQGQTITSPQLTTWQRKRIAKTYRVLGKKMPQHMDNEALMQDLTTVKQQYSYSAMQRHLQASLTVSQRIMTVASKMSGSKRKFAQVQFIVEGISASEVQQAFADLMLVNDETYSAINLRACPDHYVLRPYGKEGQEVIEFTGNSPLPVQFFIVYGEQTGIMTPRDEDYAYQTVGVARAKDGTVIGGVRHQFADTENGVEVKASVEFPALCPSSMVRAHEWHLACEFSYWLQWIINNR